MILRGSLFSRVLEMSTGVTFVIPGFRSGGAPYPYQVCYLLHGLGGAHGDYVDYTRLSEYAEDHHTLFVMPEAARSFYSDRPRGQKFFAYVADELPELCSKTFNISSEREDTTVAGVSMGGYGALKCALARPDRYGRCLAFSSPCLFLREQFDTFRSPEGLRRAAEEYGEQLIHDFRAIFGEDLRWNPDNDLVRLAESLPAGSERPHIFMACGDRDPYLAENRRFADELGKHGFDCTYEERPGGHDWIFFDSALRRAVQWSTAR